MKSKSEEKTLLFFGMYSLDRLDYACPVRIFNLYHNLGSMTPVTLITGTRVGRRPPILKYLLTGLVRCGHCGRAMVASSSPLYTTKSGEERRYVAYCCPGHASRLCANGKRIPEEWLRQQVITTLMNRLFPTSDE